MTKTKGFFRSPRVRVHVPSKEMKRERILGVIGSGEASRILRERAGIKPSLPKLKFLEKKED